MYDSPLGNGATAHKDGRLAHSRADGGKAENGALEFAQCFGCQWVFPLPAISLHGGGETLYTSLVVAFMFDDEARPTLLDGQPDAILAGTGGKVIVRLLADQIAFDVRV